MTAVSPIEDAMTAVKSYCSTLGLRPLCQYLPSSLPLGRPVSVSDSDSGLLCLVTIISCLGHLSQRSSSIGPPFLLAAFFIAVKLGIMLVPPAPQSYWLPQDPPSVMGSLCPSWPRLPT
jgi:hypothetical protein